MNDETFALLCNSFKNLRHLKSLILPYNLLTSTSISVLIANYAASARRLEVIDVRDNNNVTEDDGRRLYASFSNSIRILNGMEIRDIKVNRAPIMDLSLRRLRSSDVPIIIGLINSLGNSCVELNLSKNLLDAKSLIQLCPLIKTLKALVKYDFSFNPLCGAQGSDMSGCDLLVKTMRSSNYVTTMNLTGNICILFAYLLCLYIYRNTYT